MITAFPASAVSEPGEPLHPVNYTTNCKIFLLIGMGLVFFTICIKDLTDCKTFLLDRILFSFPIWVSLSLIYSVGFCFVLLLHGAFFVLLSHFSSLKALILCIYLFLMKAEILMLPNEYWS